MKDLEDKDNSIIWKFPYKKGNASKIVFKCSCGAENEMLDIKRSKYVDKNRGNSWDVVLDTPIESSVAFRCGECDNSFEVKHRGYTHEDIIEDRNCEIDNLLQFKTYKTT